MKKYIFLNTGLADNIITMELVKVTTGLYWVEIPDKNFYLMCGCPMDSIKHLTNKGIIKPVEGASQYTETGPNAILLSDIPVQNGYFSNLAEFPILHMMYKQGMVLPGHPRNDGSKPWIIGTSGQVEAQKNYIFRGNYGLAAKEEFYCSGCDETIIDNAWQLKMKFNFNTILEPEKLIDTTIIDRNPVELKPGIILERMGLNLYKLTYNGESILIDLNLKEEELYEPPYKLENTRIEREYFSVVHVGEGNGWDNTRPCMGSVLTFKGKIYLIDAGPNIEYSLNALGISVNDVDGIFHTHIHDDHFAGLTYLVMADNKVKYFATPIVMETARKKLTALMGVKESMFDEVFQTIPLDWDQWNSYDDLEIKPIFSPHPVETSIFYFRAHNGTGYKSYAHLADIITKNVLEQFVSDDPEKGISREWFDEIWDGYLEKADIKKVDVGGGFVHGTAADFADDPSDLLLLSHTDRPLTDEEKKVGSSTSFGVQHILIPSVRDYKMEHAYSILSEYFPEVHKNELDLLIYNSKIHFNSGEILAEAGDMLDYVYLILFGKVDFKFKSSRIHYEMTSGSMIGITNSVWGKPTSGTYQASSYVESLKIPIDIMKAFLTKHAQMENLKDITRIMQNLRHSSLFGSRVSSRKLLRLSQKAGIIHLLPGDKIPRGWPEDLYFINKGVIDILYKGAVYTSLNRGDTWGGYAVPENWKHFDISAKVGENSPVELYRFSSRILKEIPVIKWKLFQKWSCWDATP